MSEKLILTVDDDLSTLLYLEQILKSEGYRVLCASGASEAKEILRNELPDLLLLDVQMPGMGGFELLEEIRNTPRLAQIPAIFLTVKDTSEDETRGLKEGVVDYLSKDILTPVRVPILCHRLKNFFTWQENERLRGVLATIVSANHEINNPMMVIQGSADLLRLRGLLDDNSEAREAVDRISDACQRVKDVLGQISSLATWEGKSYLDGVEMLDLEKA
jgi:CheY-like chemotaxis protein